ncbi:hypothetical protein L7F22_056083 [Adiantum nelumboides]|nr:hypothetical protein [Adiantum nelumboides]
MASKSILIQANLEMEELRLRFNAFSLDAGLLLQKASGHVDKNDDLLQGSGMESTHLRDLELVLSKLIFGKGILEKQQVDTLKALSKMEHASTTESFKLKKSVGEHVGCITELDSRSDTLMNETDELEKQMREALESN